METIEDRAKSYAMQVGCFRPDLCAADYIAGAKEERILVIEKFRKWLQKKTYKHVDDRNLTMMFSSTNEMLEDLEKYLNK